MALIGYARVSTQEQHLHLQQDALQTAGCIKIFTDTASGARAERKGLEEALNFLSSTFALFRETCSGQISCSCLRAGCAIYAAGVRA
jgi:Resolvase, N terminal domain